MRPVLTLLLLGSISIHAAPLSSLQERQSAANTAYDYIFIGGGTAGLVAAYRLAEANQSLAILILEGGSIPFDTVPASRVPAAVASLQHTSADWNYTACVDLSCRERLEWRAKQKRQKADTGFAELHRQEQVYHIHKGEH